MVSLKEGNVGNIINRAIVIHEKPDDFEGVSEIAGARIACGVIESKQGNKIFLLIWWSNV